MVPAIWDRTWTRTAPSNGALGGRRKEGRTAEVQRLAEEMVAAFETQEVHREALAEFLLFQEAAGREEVTAGLVRELAAYLASARSNPELRFR